MNKVDWITIALVLCVMGASLIIYLKTRAKSTIKVSATQTVDEEKLRIIYNKTVELIDQEKFYLNKNLKLSDLSKELSCNERMVSRSINLYGNGNFNKFINSFRVEHSKEILVGGNFDHYTIEAIAEESGFANKVSFYNAFKIETGMSPTQFRALKQSNLR